MHNDTDAIERDEHIEFLCFRLGGLEYGLDFRKVEELRPLGAMERFANDGQIVNGVAVSRGVIMPIVDMRIAFGGHADSSDPRTDVIILKLSSCIMGMVVDGVTDVVRLRTAAIGAIPGGGDVDYLLGLCEHEGRRLILVDIDKLMSVRQAAGETRQAAA